jgi:hypothetical protein
MRVLGIVVLAITLAGCTGDRIKQGMISPDGRPASVIASTTIPRTRMR